MALVLPLAVSLMARRSAAPCAAVTRGSAEVIAWQQAAVAATQHRAAAALSPEEEQLHGAATGA